MSDDPNREDGEEEEDSTKQVDRSALNEALNRSVDSSEVLRRVNASIGQELHAEGTAKVDRDSVREYLEAAKSGEFPAMLRTDRDDRSGGPSAAAAESEADFATGTEGQKQSVFVSEERDETGPRAAILRRSPSGPSSATPAPEPIDTPGGESEAVQPSQPPPGAKPLPRAKPASRPPPTPFPKPAPDTDELGEEHLREVEMPNLPAPAYERPEETQDIGRESTSSWRLGTGWVIVLAIVGALFGIALATIFLMLRG